MKRYANVSLAMLLWGATWAAALPTEDFESGIGDWIGVNAEVTLLPTGHGDSSGSVLVKMNGGTVFDGARLDISSSISEFSSAFANGELIEVSARVRVPDSFTGNVIPAIVLRANNGAKCTFLDRLRTDASAGIQSEDGWMRMRAVLPAFRQAWSEYENDVQSGALYSPTSLEMILRGSSAGDEVVFDAIQFTRMVPGIFSCYTPPTESAPDDFLRPGGGSGGFRLIDASGADIILNGINLWLYSDDLNDKASLLWNYYLYAFDEEDMEQLAQDYGMNVLRLNLDYRWFEKSYDEASEISTIAQEGFAWLDRIIELATEHGLYLILDLHTPPGGYQGPDGGTATYFKDTVAGYHLRKRTENLWVAIATRYKHEPRIAAYDLINEPRPKKNVDWYNEAARLVSAIRSSGGDANHLILVEAPFPTDGNGWSILRIDDPRILYDIHYYSPGGFTFNSDTHSTFESENTDLSDGIFGEISFVQKENWEDSVVADLLPATYAMTENAALSIYPGQLILFSRSELLPDATGESAAPANIGEYGLKKAVFDRAPAAAKDYIMDLHQVLDLYGVSRQYWNLRGDMGLYPSFAGYAAVPRLRNAALHDVFLQLKSERGETLGFEDRDRDSLPDVWEASRLGSREFYLGEDDADGDGFTNRQEFVAGTDPGDASSFFIVTLQGANQDGVSLGWRTMPDRIYSLERSPDLTPGSFQTATSLRGITRRGVNLMHPEGTSSSSAFYRVTTRLSTE